ncbi:MAG: carboxypeptidase-like regulatory domain-containing protein, partial [Saprospiraceae bacterium]|nr:carboxypeptidase-like regulatory domain-containing protein [Saprospiraceae bacterium]
MKTIATFLLCWLSAAGAAQPLVWQGVITHAQTKQPIEHVNIYAPQNDVGAVSDVTGRFSISLEKLPDTLVISCIGFATVKWPLRSTSAAFLTIALEPQSGLLPEVSVSALKKAAIIYPPEYSVVDYELYEGLPLLLVCKNSLSGYWLVALDEQDQVRGELKLKRLQPEALAKSCLGGVYLLSDNGAHVIKVVNGMPVMAESISLLQYNQLVLPCVAANTQ